MTIDSTVHEQIDTYKGGISSIRSKIDTEIHNHNGSHIHYCLTRCIFRVLCDSRSNPTATTMLPAYVVLWYLLFAFPT